MQLGITWIRTQRFHREDDGQDLLEYGLLMALIAITALGAVTALGNAILSVFWTAIAAASV
jgi:Flp pilus assembly pilin Flp